MDTPNSSPSSRLLGDTFSPTGFDAELRASNAAHFSLDNHTQVDFTVGSPSSKDSSVLTACAATVVLGFALYYGSRHPGMRRILEQSRFPFDHMEPALAGA